MHTRQGNYYLNRNKCSLILISFCKKRFKIRANLGIKIEQNYDLVTEIGSKLVPFFLQCLFQI